MLKHQMTPLTKGGTRTVHAGKGSRQAPLAARDVVTRPPGAPLAGINDYAKATPMAQPSPPTMLGGMPSGGSPA